MTMLKDFFLAKLERESDLVRKAIERVPEGRNDYKPHERSMELGYLAALVAGMLGWIAMMIERDELNLDDPSTDGFRTKAVATQAELLGSLHDGVAKARRALESTNDEHLAKSWAFKMNGNVVSQQPRSIMIADAVFSHLAHHRGQLTVYLRMVGSTVPAIYGPSADERF
ncbi:MAG TPA: DinB family protein [Terracidiphilus sp.]|nr:DinB family protein [Terracidiphilus sp.]